MSRSKFRSAGVLHVRKRKEKQEIIFLRKQIQQLEEERSALDEICSALQRENTLLAQRLSCIHNVVFNAKPVDEFVRDFIAP